MSIPTDQDITNALFAGGGILLNAARHLSAHLGRPISRAALAGHIEASRVLQAVQQIAVERSWDRSIEGGRDRRRQRRSAAMKAAWARRREGQTDRPGGSHTSVGGAPSDLEPAVVLDASDAPNARGRARTSGAITAATVQAERDKRLCCAKTRKGFPCVRRVVPGKNRCPNHGGLSSGPKTAAGKARIGAAQRARWERYRQERGMDGRDDRNRP